MVLRLHLPKKVGKKKPEVDDSEVDGSGVASSKKGRKKKVDASETSDVDPPKVTAPETFVEPEVKPNRKSKAGKEKKPAENEETQQYDAKPVLELIQKSGTADSFMSCNTLMLGESKLVQQCPMVNGSADESAQVAQVLQLLSSNPALASQLMALLNPSSGSSKQ
jgi:hypothetical protein